MLLAVEGGGFFSSSASGYSKGLTLLLLGQKNEEKPMRVTPWNQYQLVDQESDPDLLLASGKNRLVRGCASFVCFGRAAAGLESPSPLKVGPTQQQDVLPEPPVSDKGKDDTHTADLVDNDTIAKKVDLKSSLKKTTISIPVSSAVGNESEALSKKGSNVPCHTERRKVQWTDVSGGELVEVREFEASARGTLSHQRWKSTLVARNSLVVSPEVNFQMLPNSIFFPTMGVYKRAVFHQKMRKGLEDLGTIFYLLLSPSDFRCPCLTFTQFHRSIRF